MGVCGDTGELGGCVPGTCSLTHINPAEPVTADLPVIHTHTPDTVCVYRQPHLLDTNTLSGLFLCSDVDFVLSSLAPRLRDGA